MAVPRSTPLLDDFQRPDENPVAGPWIDAGYGSFGNAPGPGCVLASHELGVGFSVIEELFAPDQEAWSRIAALSGNGGDGLGGNVRFRGLPVPETLAPGPWGTTHLADGNQENWFWDIYGDGTADFGNGGYSDWPQQLPGQTVQQTVYDPFNAGDENPLATNGRPVPLDPAFFMVYPGLVALKRAGGVYESSTGADAASYCTHDYDANQEVWGEIRTMPGGGETLQVGLRDNIDAGAQTGYKAVVNADGSGELVGLVAGAATTLATCPAGTFVAGDVVGISAVGSQITFWRRHAAGTAWAHGPTPLDQQTYEVIAVLSDDNAPAGKIWWGCFGACNYDYIGGGRLIDLFPYLFAGDAVFQAGDYVGCTVVTNPEGPFGLNPVRPTDDFDRPDEDPIVGDWATYPTGGATPMQIIGGVCTATTPNSSAYVPSVHCENQEAWARLTALPSLGLSIGLRDDLATQGYYLTVHSDGSVTVSFYNAGGGFDLASTPVGAIQVGDIIGFTCSGARLVAWRIRGLVRTILIDYIDQNGQGVTVSPGVLGYAVASVVGPGFPYLAFGTAGAAAGAVDLWGARSVASSGDKGTLWRVRAIGTGEFVDDFQRPDETPIQGYDAFPDNWGPLPNLASHEVVGGAFFTAATFGPDQEAWVDLVTLAPGAAVIVRETLVDTEIGVWSLNVNGGDGSAALNMNDATDVLDLPAATFADGDRVGVTAIGTDVQVWRVRAGVFTLLGTASGPIGDGRHIGWYVGGAASRIGGGDVVATLTNIMEARSTSITGIFESDDGEREIALSRIGFYAFGSGCTIDRFGGGSLPATAGEIAEQAELT